MKFKHLRLVEKIMSDAVKAFCLAVALGLSSMVSHAPGSNEFILRWEPLKLLPYILAWISLTAVRAALRYRAWAKEQAEMIRQLD